MKILILGGEGMIGNQLFKYFQSKHEVRATVKNDLTSYAQIYSFKSTNVYSDIDLCRFDRLSEVVRDFQPEVVINAAGIVKQSKKMEDKIEVIEMNSLLPHRLARLCNTVGARLIHLSTDCVFSGKKGDYLETDIADADDLYGRSKLLGEIDSSRCLTIRKSVIGKEIGTGLGLLEWFLSQKGKTIKGFTKAIYTGFTIIEISRIIEMILTNHQDVFGVLHVASEPISKYDLLMLIKDKFNISIDIIPDDSFNCDRSLNSTKFRDIYKYTPPSWSAMIEELAKTYDF